MPIVTGERRKAKEKKKTDEPTKKQYRKKSANTVRLCAYDIMTRENLERFQDSYAEKMEKYGLQRGIRGSDARHISTPQFYRELFAQNEDLKESIGYLEEEKQEVYEKVRNMYDRKDEAREKFLNMDNYVRQKGKELEVTETRLQQLQQEYEPYKAQEDLNMFLDIFPQVAESLRMMQLCRGVGLAVDTIKELFSGVEVSYSGKLHSQEHDRYFNVKDAKLQILKEKDTPNKLRLSLNGMNIIDWFREKYQDLKQAIRPHVKPSEKKGRGIG